MAKVAKQLTELIGATPILQLCNYEEEHGINANEREGSLSVYKVNINFDTELAEQYDVQSVPTLLLFKGGAEVARQSGAVRKDALNAWIDDNVK